jgi:hypothetical protein
MPWMRVWRASALGRFFCFVGINKLTATQCMEICVVGPNEDSVPIMISPVFADNQNVYDLDTLNFKLE